MSAYEVRVTEPILISSTGPVALLELRVADNIPQRVHVTIDGRDVYCTSIIVHGIGVQPSEVKPTIEPADLAPGTLVEYRHAGHNFDGLVLEVIERFDDGDSGGPWYRCAALCADDAGWPVRRPVAGIHGSRLHPAPDGARLGDDVGCVRRATGQTSILPESDTTPVLTRPLEPGDLAVVRRAKDQWNGHVVRVLLPAGSDLPAVDDLRGDPDRRAARQGRR